MRIMQTARNIVLIGAGIIAGASGCRSHSEVSARILKNHGQDALVKNCEQIPANLPECLQQGIDDLAGNRTLEKLRALVTSDKQAGIMRDPTGTEELIINTYTASLRDLGRGAIPPRGRQHVKFDIDTHNFLEEARVYYLDLQGRIPANAADEMPLEPDFAN